MRVRTPFKRHAWMLASVFGGALMLAPTMTLAADADDHPAATQERLENARDRYQDRKEDIRDTDRDRDDRGGLQPASHVKKSTVMKVPPPAPKP
jgi:hypothetical protein